MSTQLDPSAVQTVLDVLREVQFFPSQWRPLGRRLGVKDVDLDAIEANHYSREGVERCLEEVIRNWIRNGENKWEKLVEAISLCEGSGGGTNVAQKLRRKVGLQGEAPVHNLPHQESGDSAIGSEGRPSISSPISPLSPLSPLTTRQLSAGEMFSGEEVGMMADQLNETFNNIVAEIQKALKDSNADPREVVNILHRKDAQFTYVPGDFFRSLRKLPDVIELFFELDEYWDYLNYFLLERLFLQPDTKDLLADHLKHVYDSLKECMLRYKESMEYFRKHTDVRVYCSLVIKRRARSVPPGFKELVKKRNFKTLEDVEQFRQELAEEYKLFECLVFLKKIESGSVILTFWIPSCATEAGIELEPGEPGGGNEGSSVDPVIIKDGVQVEWSPLSKAAPFPEESEKTGDQTRAVVKKGSVAGSVITAVSKLVVPKYVLDPIVLMLAVSNGDKEEVKLLLSKGADPNASPPMVEFTPLMEASRQGNVEIARLLLDKGANPNQTNNEGWTALKAAANNGRYGTVDILLDRGAIPDMQDHSEWSALMAAVYKRHDEVALRIIKGGATPHLQDKNHTNALLLAIATNEQEQVVEALLNRVDPSKLDLQDSYGETALIFACKNSNLKLVRRLLFMKVNPNLCNSHGETPVLIATKRGELEIVRELLENRANPNMGNIAPLMVAADSGYEDTAHLLVKYGAEHYQQHDRGVLPFEMAELRNFTDLAKKLNPEQFTSKTPREVLKLTKRSLASVQQHLSLGPLMFLPTDKKRPLFGLPSFIQGALQRIF